MVWTKSSVPHRIREMFSDTGITFYRHGCGLCLHIARIAVTIIHTCMPLVPECYVSTKGLQP